AVDKEEGSVKKEFPCPSCRASVKKTDCRRAVVELADDTIGETITQAKQIPVLINYSMGKQRVEKTPDEKDLALIEKISSSSIPYCFPTDRMPNGYNTAQPFKSHGISHVHHFYTKRNLWVLSCVYNKLAACDNELKDFLKFTFEQIILGFAKISRYVPTHFSQVNQYLSGTLYIGSQIVEVSLPYIINGKIKRLPKALMYLQNNNESNSLISTQSMTDFEE
ncbi:unnamed protein product, partial [marine sediment metagenome]